MTGLPVLDIGGSHVSAAVGDTATWRPLSGTRHRLPLRSEGSADEIIATIAQCARTVGPLIGSTLAVAMPGPFDYEAGIGRYNGVAKFDALNGVDVRGRLSAALDGSPANILFLNDAVAFGIGEWVARATQRHDKKCDRLVAITLGTGVGSAFINAGTPVTTGPLVPPNGYAYRLRIEGRPLEDVVSTRAIVAAYAEHAGTAHAAAEVDVRCIADHAKKGDKDAIRAFADAAHALGNALAPWLINFEADALIVGGGIARSWCLVGPPLAAGIEEGALHPAQLTVVPSRDPEASIAIGAAWHAHAVRGM